MNKELKITLLFLFLFLGRFFISAQIKNQPLEKLLPAIEKKYQVSFSYADTTIRGISVNLNMNNLSLQEVLFFLQQNTPLVFIQIDEVYISISKKPEENSPFVFEELNEVVVNNYLTTGIYKNNTGSISIQPQKMGILPGLTDTDVLHSIQSLPGIISVDESVSNINIRGGTHDQNLILYEGIRMYQSGHFFGLISAFNPNLTKNVTVIKNGANAKYGENISGVVDLKLEDIVTNQTHYGGGINLIAIDGFASLPFNKKTSIQIAARRSVTDWVNTPTYDNYFKRIFQDSDLTNTNDAAVSKDEDFYFYDASLKFLYDITEKDQIRINFLTVFNDLNYQEEATINSQDEVIFSSLTQKNLATGITYHKLWNDNYNSTLQAYFTNYDLDASNYDFVNNQQLIQENKVTEAGIKLDNNLILSNNFKLNFGAQALEVGISNLQDVNNPPFESYIKYVLRTLVGYAETTYQSNDKNTLLTVGFRNNYFTKFKQNSLEPRLHFNQQFLNYFNFEFSGELKTQTSTQVIDLQKDFLGIEKRRWILANNDDIPILKSKQVSAGISFEQNKLLISAEAFIKKVDGITAKSQGFQNQFQFINDIGSYTIHGIDFLINKRYQNFSTWLSYTFSENTYTFNNLHNGNAFANNFDIKHTINFAGTYKWNNLKFALGLNWRSGKPYTQADYVENNEIVYKSPNGSRLQDYVRLDFSSTYNFSIGKHQAKVGVSIWNVLNKQNVLNTYFTNDGKNISQIENYSLGLTPNVSFSISL